MPVYSAIDILKNLSSMQHTDLLSLIQQLVSKHSHHLK